MPDRELAGPVTLCDSERGDELAVVTVGVIPAVVLTLRCQAVGRRRRVAQSLEEPGVLGEIP